MPGIAASGERDKVNAGLMQAIDCMLEQLSRDPRPLMPRVNRDHLDLTGERIAREVDQRRNKPNEPPVEDRDPDVGLLA